MSKTDDVRRLALEITGSEDVPVIDFSDPACDVAIAKLLGVRPGFEGSETEGSLTEGLRKGCGINIVFLGLTEGNPETIANAIGLIVDACEQQTPAAAGADAAPTPPKRG